MYILQNIIKKDKWYVNKYNKMELLLFFKKVYVDVKLNIKINLHNF